MLSFQFSCTVVSDSLQPHGLQHARPDKAHAGIKIIGRNTNNHRYAEDTTLISESEEELKSLLMMVENKSENLA